ncbi:unnamed protein product [Protopolystoma xenopodis]|uniref:Uncharacterized protein n=1 Tax=Protopolystoma xenopodis TaxID=117903 RepID=A0A3S5C875_9PLAT|nr:unnamed protein product [Protopolystoma xenopodis]
MPVLDGAIPVAQAPPGLGSIGADRSNQVITISLLEIVQDPQASGALELLDMATGKQLAFWPVVKATDDKFQSPPRHINNVTMTSQLFGQNGDGGGRRGMLWQGVSSWSSHMIVRFTWRKPRHLGECSRFRRCVRMLFQISVGSSKL